MPASFTFQKIADPIEPFGSDKLPHHSILRLRDFQPHLQDLLIVSSTASTEIGLLTRAKSPLATDKAANAITGVFTMTELLDDTTRPTLPMTDSMTDSTTVGIAIDLSTKEKVYKPIPSDEELAESPGPLPGLWVLTHEGLLCSWWVVYTDSIKSGTTYSGFAALEGAAVSSTPKQPPLVAQALSYGTAGAPTSSAVSATPAFGASSELGQNKSPWAAASTATPASNAGGATFGSSSFGGASLSGSTFGKPSAIGFGQSSQLGMRTSPWAGSGGPGPALSQSFAGFAKSGSNQSPFNAVGASSSSASGGGFSGFAKQGGFASVANNSGGSSVFASDKKPTSNPFASSPGDADTAFPAKASGDVFAPTTFKLESSFKADPSQSEGNDRPAPSAPSMFSNAFVSALSDAGNQARPTTPPSKDEDMDAEQMEQTPQAASKCTLSQSNEASTTPTTTPAPTRFGFPSPAPGASLLGQPSGFGGGGSLCFSSSGAQEQAAEPETPKIKTEGQEEPLPPDSTSKTRYPMGESSSSSGASHTADASLVSSTPSKAEAAPFPPDFTTPKPAKMPDAESPLSFGSSESSEPTERPDVDDAPFPPDFTKSLKPAALGSASAFQAKAAAAEDGASSAPDLVLPKPPSKEPSTMPSLPDGDDDDDGSDLGEDVGSEGSGVDVAKEMSPTTSGISTTPGHTPQSSFGGLGGSGSAMVKTGQDRSRPLFGEISRNAPLFSPPPSAPSPRSPSPLRGAVPQRATRSEAERSVSVPGMASKMPGSRKPQAPLQMRGSIVSREKLLSIEDQFLAQQRKLKERQEAAETRPLVDEDDYEVQRLLASEVEGTLQLDEFIAHFNVAPPAKDNIPSQVEAVYRDINSMIDTLGLNARAVKAFVKGHTEDREPEGRTKEDLEDPEGWVLCEVSDLGEVLDTELYGDLEDGRVQDLEDKLDECLDLARDMQKLRAKQEDMKRVIMARLDPGQADISKAFPLSAEQAAQQNELRRGLALVATLLGQAEEALILLKTRIASVASSSGRGNANVPTVEAVMRTIGRMTSMAEKRSGDIDVLETHLRTLRLGSASREGSPMTTPQARKSVLLAPETPSRNARQSLSGSVMSLGGAARATTPRKKISGFSREEKEELMAKRARRQAVLSKLSKGVGEKGVGVWNMEDIE